MQPYVIKQGDYLALLAYRFGFDANTVWNDPANDNLRKRRPDPNMLSATDILYIPNPEKKKPSTFSLASGQTNSFVSTAPEVDISLKFSDASRASQAFTISELPALTGLTVGGDGTAMFKVPVSLPFFTLIFTSDGAAFKCKTGYIDPIGTLTGIVQRLQNLGYLDRLGAYDVGTIDAIRRALSAFRYVQRGDAPAAPDADAAANPSGASSDDDASDDGAGDDPDDHSYDAAPADPDDDSDDDSDDADSRSATSVLAASSGLDDQGVLSDEMTNMLLKAHGS